MQAVQRWAVQAGRGSAGACASALLVLCTLDPAQAQFSRYAQEIEIKGLDLHPRPSLLRETGTRFYGAIDLGLVSEAAPPPQGRCGKVDTQRVANITPSLLGLRATEMLQDGWSASVQLEHGLNPATGQPVNDCGLFFDRASTVGLSHRQLGRLEFGRREHPAYAVALRGDPWSGNGPASPGDGRAYGRPVAANGSAPAGSSLRVRAPQALTYTSPEHQPVWLQLQASLTRQALGVPDPATADDEREVGAALHWQTVDMHAAIGFQRWNRNTWALPVSLDWTGPDWTAHLGLAGGRRTDGRWHNLQIGASLPERSGARPGLLRLGLNVHRDAGGRLSARAGAGRVWPLARSTQIEADAGFDIGRTDLQRRLRVGLALQHRFSL